MSDNNNHKLNGNTITGKNLMHQQQNHPQPHHIQTAATIHKQHTNSGRNNHLHQQQQQPVPPRYQPPPQPPGNGILKNIPTIIGKSTTADIHHHHHNNNTRADLNIPSHLNIKYPPEIPKLTTVYIPDTIKNNNSGTNSSRYLQQRHRISDYTVGQQQQQQQQQQQHQQNQDEFLLRQQQSQEMLKFVRKNDVVDPTINNQIGGRLTSEQNRQLQALINELRTIKEANQRLSDDNQELRDLCCFLDDDRQKGRKLAREWQRFGRYTASVMRQEVSAYQNKLRQLDDKQQELIRDNLELKELCLYLDEERAHVAANTLCVNCGNVTCPPRDDGDGSSSSTNADELMRNFDRQITDHHLRSTLSDQTLQYVRSLERRIHQLEDEKSTVPNDNNDPISGRPEAVVRALQVLEVREQLERDRENLPSNGNNNNNNNGVVNNNGIRNEQMDDGEKALVREMCNVVWRKLEESPNGPNIDPL